MLKLLNNHFPITVQAKSITHAEAWGTEEFRPSSFHFQGKGPSKWGLAATRHQLPVKWIC